MLSSDSSIVHAQALRNSTDMGYSGKVFVYTGILPVCGNEDGLAAVATTRQSEVAVWSMEPCWRNELAMLQAAGVATGSGKTVETAAAPVRLAPATGADELANVLS